MQSLKSYLPALAVLLAGALIGCSNSANKSPDVSSGIHKALDQAGFKDVSASEDRDKGVVTLSGHVATDGDKAQAESIAKSMAAGQVVSDQIGVVPPADAHAAKEANSDLDKGIEQNLDAALIQDRLNKTVKYSVKNHVVTLSGSVDSQASRATAQQVAASVPNVAQVVNELQIKGQKATSSN
jgi:osmotically-inducible protein OsmY